MKKSKLLSMLTAGAVVCTTFGTFAAWDTLEGTTSATITVANKKVAVTVDALTFDAGDDTAANQIVYKGTVGFDITNYDKLTTLKLTPTVSNETATNPVDITGKYDVKITQDNDTLTNDQGIYTDTALAASNSYKVEIIIEDETLVGQDLSVKIDALAAY